MSEPTLVILPSVPVWRDGNTLSFDRKFYDGMMLYKKMWPGAIKCIMNAEESNLPDFGIVTLKSDELEFGCEVLKKDEYVNAGHLLSADIVLASGDSFDQLQISAICNQINAKCIYIIENIPETRYQIAAFSTSNPLIKLRRFFYIWNGERKRLKAFNLAHGLQCNGTGAFEEYQQVNNKLLYFDTRINKDLLISNEELTSRLSYLTEKKPLRLAFSGRLIAIKGADHLVKLAQLLTERELDFSLTIFGSGDLEDSLKTFVKEHHLEEKVALVGAVDFYDELIPKVKKNVDLFVMLHRQSDPSCTYLETLSCGVPIIGYNNKAFSGLLTQADIGWGCELDDINGIADIVERLNSDREYIAQKAKNSIEYARQHDFETTFQRRIDQLYQTAKSAS